MKDSHIVNSGKGTRVSYEQVGTEGVNCPFKTHLPVSTEEERLSSPASLASHVSKAGRKVMSGIWKSSTPGQEQASNGTHGRGPHYPGREKGEKKERKNEVGGRGGGVSTKGWPTGGRRSWLRKAGDCHMPPPQRARWQISLALVNPTAPTHPPTS